MTVPVVINTEVVPCPVCGGVSIESELTISTQDFSFETCANKFEYVRCECQVTYLRNRPLPSELASIYPDDYSGYKRRQGIVAAVRRRNFFSKYTAALKETSPTSQVQSVLDFGCGNGEFLSAVLSKNAGEGKPELTGYDFSLSSVPANLLQKVNFVDDFDAVIARGPFDLVFFNQVIEHLPDPIMTLSKLRDSMSSGSIILIETPSLTGFDFRLSPRERWGGVACSAALRSF